eukprot:CAMPEP_0170636290 /NCGR_PEP_ID=MMETSP0224-20130122/37713_1 /TAXON_ID=285029 /ORGANISM="Togula jolla, Strain CCCM 725" /LENGTH=235 /DNA_ID=CAMNT_0010965921 /DNA_START=97 /DNA_END=800 /DNA_ORIENTATION=-
MTTDPPSTSRRVGNAGSWPLHCHGGVEEMLLLPLGDNALLEATMQACTPIVGCLTAQLLVAVHLLVQHSLINVAGDLSVGGVGLARLHFGSAARLHNLRLTENEVSILLHILPADKVLRDQESRELPGISWGHDEASILQQGVLTVNGHSAGDVPPGVVSHSDGIALSAPGADVTNSDLLATVLTALNQDVVNWQSCLATTGKDLQPVQVLPLCLWLGIWRLTERPPSSSTAAAG